MKPEQTIARPLVVDPWPSAGLEVNFEATSEECRKLAERCVLVSVGKFRGHAQLDRCADGRTIRLCGRLEAEVVQSCVVSLEDVPATVAETFECRFAPAGVDLADDLAWDEDLEQLEGAELDLGEVFAQQLSLALDPYPRAAGAEDLVSAALGPNIAFGEDRQPSALALALEKGDIGGVRGSPSRQGRE